MPTGLESVEEAVPHAAENARHDAKSSVETAISKLRA